MPPAKLLSIRYAIFIVLQPNLMIPTFSTESRALGNNNPEKESRKPVTPASSNSRFARIGFSLLISCFSAPLPALENFCQLATGKQTEVINSRVLKQWHEQVWGEGRADLVHKLVAPYYVRNQDGESRRIPAAQYAEEIAVGLERGLSYRVHECLAFQDKVWVRWSTRAKTWYGSDMSGKGMQIYRFSDGLLAETWVIYDYDGSWE